MRVSACDHRSQACDWKRVIETSEKSLGVRTLTANARMSSLELASDRQRSIVVGYSRSVFDRFKNWATSASGRKWSQGGRKVGRKVCDCCS